MIHPHSLTAVQFMQRSAASTPSSPSTPVEQPSKRQRLSTASYNGTPSSTPQTDVQSTEEGAASDVHQHIDKVNKDGKWYLSYEAPQISSAHTPLRVISAGYSTLDTNDSAGRESTTIELPGRRSFGNFNRKVEVSATTIQACSRLLVSAETAESRHFIRGL